MIFDTQLLSEIRSLEQGGETLRKAVKNLLKEIGINQVVRKGKIPKTGSALIISNHPGVLDTLILFSEIQRDDFHFVALSTYGVFGKAVQKHLLPIYRKRRLNHKIYEYPLNLQVEGKPPDELSAAEVQKRNRATISEAAKLLKSGAAVSVFPTGSVGKSLPGSNWKSGIGYLISQGYDSNTLVIFAKITGTRKSDLVAYLIQPLRRLFFRPRPISIEFSPEYKLGDLVRVDRPPKDITYDLEKRYQYVWENL